MESEKLGIEKLETILRFSVSTGKTLAEDLKDGKIQASEAIGLVLLIPKAIGAFKDIKGAIEEAKDIDPEEAQKLIIAILEELDVAE